MCCSGWLSRCLVPPVFWKALLAGCPFNWAPLYSEAALGIPFLGLSRLVLSSASGLSICSVVVAAVVVLALVGSDWAAMNPGCPVI